MAFSKQPSRLSPSDSIMDFLPHRDQDEGVKRPDLPLQSMIASIMLLAKGVKP